MILTVKYLKMAKLAGANIHVSIGISLYLLDS